MEKKRLQFDFTGEALEQLDALQQQMGFATRADLVRHALRLFQWAFDQTHNQDGTILIEKNGQLREVAFPFWSAHRSLKSNNGERSKQTDEDARKVFATRGADATAHS